MEYRGSKNFTNLCIHIDLELNHINDFNDYRLDGLKCALKFGTMNKLRWFIHWMSTRMMHTIFDHYDEHLLALNMILEQKSVQWVTTLLNSR